VNNLKNARKTLNKIPHINCGGCGISALALARWIKKNQPENKAKIIFMYSEDKVNLYNRNEAKLLIGNTEELFAPNHACIFYNNLYIDSNCFFKRSDFKFFQEIKSEQLLLDAINNIGTWNEDFKRENITKIEILLDINLSDVRRG